MDIISLKAALSDGGVLEIWTDDDLAVLSQAAADGMDLSGLRTLSLFRIPVSNISVLSELAGLEKLDLSNMQICRRFPA